MTTATVSTGVTTHGILKLEFAAIGMTQEEFTLKFNEFMTSQFEASMTNLDGEKIQLETFDYQIEKLETFRDEEWA